MSLLSITHLWIARTLNLQWRILRLFCRLLRPSGQLLMESSPAKFIHARPSGHSEEPEKPREQEYQEQQRCLLLDIPRELRDGIWEHCVRDYESTKAAPGNNSTTKVIIENGFLVSALLINKQIKREYEQAVRKRMRVVLVDMFEPGGCLSPPPLVESLLKVSRIQLLLLCMCHRCEARTAMTNHCCVQDEFEMHQIWIQSFASMFQTLKSFHVKVGVSWPLQANEQWPAAPHPIRLVDSLDSLIRHVPQITGLEVYRWRKDFTDSTPLRGISAKEETDGNRDLYVSWSKISAMEEATRLVNEEEAMANVERRCADPDIKEKSASRRATIFSNERTYGWVPGPAPEDKEKKAAPEKTQESDDDTTAASAADESNEETESGKGAHVGEDVSATPLTY